MEVTILQTVVGISTKQALGKDPLLGTFGLILKAEERGKNDGEREGESEMRMVV